MAGQELLIKNSDATLHNIHGLPKINILHHELVVLQTNKIPVATQQTVLP